MKAPDFSVWVNGGNKKTRRGGVWAKKNRHSAVLIEGSALRFLRAHGSPRRKYIRKIDRKQPLTRG
jgi:hypothetical protein